MEYLIKVSAILVVFYLCYKLLLNQETFFESNRIFLLLGVATAFILPLITISKYVVVEPVIIDHNNTFSKITSQLPLASKEGSIPTTTLLLYVYITGVAILLGRFIFQFSSLIILLFNSTKKRVASYIYVLTKGTISPFSFFNWIVFNPKQFNDAELDQIITHEKVHAKQLHSIDILLVELTGIILWFNPLVWLYKKDLKQNLEFIADKNAQATTNCKKSYQHLLLKTSVPNYQVALTNNFYNSSIKKRIVMLHKNRSHKRNQLKFLIILPGLVLFLMSFNTKEVYVQAEAKTLKSTTKLQKAETIATFNSNTTNNLIAKNNVVKTKANYKAEKAQDLIAYFIESSFTDAELDNVVTKLKKHGITLKIKGVKRNSNNEITAIKIDAKSSNSNANFAISNDSAIKTVKIIYNAKDDSISIGNSNSLLHDKNNNVFTHTNGTVKIKKTGKGNNVFVYSSDEDHDNEHEIIEDDNKIIIKNGNKITEFKKANKKENVYVISSGNGKTYEVITADSLESKGNIVKLKGNVSIKSNGDNKIIELKEDGDNGNVMFIRKDEDGNIIKENVKKGSITFQSKDGKTYKTKASKNGNSAVWVSKSNEDKTLTKIGEDGNAIFFTNSDGKDPLIVMDGKVVKNKKLEDIDVKTIASVSVLKGKAAEEKYGKKAKNGVIVITTKKKND